MAKKKAAKKSRPPQSREEGAARRRPSSPGRKTTPQPNTPTPGPDDSTVQVDLLDVGPEEYGDAVLCRLAGESILIDGAHPGNYKDKGAEHPSIGRQIGDLLKQGETPYRISLVIVTHAHADHIGCLPRLVSDGIINPEWALVADPDLGWGQPADAPALGADQPPAVRQLAALLREETITRSDDDSIASLASDAANLRDTYTAMLEALEQGGTKVVRYGRDDTRALLQRFAGVGLRIVGPTVEQLAHCAELINRRTQDLLQLASAKLPDAVGADATTVVAAYRDFVQAIHADTDAFDAFSKDKGAINDQSIVTVFEVDGKRLLFTGDMQLAQPEVSDQEIVDAIAALNNELAAGAPYDLVKLSHHGSYNGFSEALWEKWGKPHTLGICAGSGSTAHPNPETLEVLKEHVGEIHWARTDHNGLSTFDFDGGPPQIKVTRGEQDDPVPNVTDLPLPVSPESAAAAGKVSTQLVAANGNMVEIRVPIGVRVSINVEVQPAGGAAGPSVGPDVQATPAERELAKITGRPVSIPIGVGRKLPKLLFITDKAKLAANIGAAETNAVLARLRTAGHVVLEQVPRLREGIRIAGLLPQSAAQARDIKGVVLLGGYDVVPARRLDALPASLRAAIGGGGDADEFFVWSDDSYGGAGANGLPELPVSRIPDGRSSQLVFAALAAGPSRANDPRHGIRNMRRPFAEPIYGTLPGAAAMLVSDPTTVSNSYSLDAERVYIMLHGDYTDATHFWGESNGGGYPTAVDLAHVPARPGAVVFTGCCWGAMPVNTRAVDFRAGQPIGPRSAASSIALRFLVNGARAFLGCTGTHYSPTAAPYNYFGGPMHTAFWAAYQAGTPPALALLRAKVAYRQGMPHGQQAGSLGEAIEYKILRQYTCLGLGW